MNLTENIKNGIKQHAQIETPNECCGLILSKGDIFQCENIASNPREDFEICPFDYLEAQKLGEIQAYYHSHPSGKENESLLDRVNRNGHNLAQVVYVQQLDDFFVFEPEKEQNTYLGRQFKWNESDCLALVLDYYKNELKLHLPDIYPDRTKWNCVNYWRFIVEAGFRTIPLQWPLKKHDCIFTQFTDIRPPHLLIYLGANKVLHQPIDDYSKIEEYGQSFREKTFAIARHTSLM